MRNANQRFGSTSLSGCASPAMIAAAAHFNSGIAKKEMQSSRLRIGATKLGCLLWLLALAFVGYFGIPAGETYWRYLQFKDAMEQEVLLHSQQTDLAIRARLRIRVDSLHLPDEAHQISIVRRNRVITIQAEYEEAIALPGHVRYVVFTPSASGPIK